MAMLTSIVTPLNATLQGVLWPFNIALLTRSFIVIRVRSITSKYICTRNLLFFVREDSLTKNIRKINFKQRGKKFYIYHSKLLIIFIFTIS